jgi:hypothetical protein
MEPLFPTVVNEPCIKAQCLFFWLRIALRVSVHGSRVTAFQVRTRCRNMEPDLATIGPQQPLTSVLRSSARYGLQLAR